MLRQAIQTGLKQAMKEGRGVETATLRLITAALKDKDIAARGKGTDPISDDAILALLQTMIKQRQESIRFYRQGNRDELAEAEEEEIRIIRTFLPEQMDAAGIEKAVKEAIDEVKAVSVKDMGKVMGLLKGKYSGRMDFTIASQSVKQTLLNR